ncbi:1,4-alpha-glucan branching protein domain-containing protein [Bacillus sp. 3255]|uniref:1,4-alpha-glucan branching protein domain-containing protein n=1 Tax=Bacillus sp. 3255 TaxID=2817904 RepID=UPI00285EAAC2|nr:1,4-alpha-glucan branching protein domain-containing protein [Bacillus sp. 3255]MDR6878553.1 1,4-alpha-glucan branching enzyme [Bacillus sp. 3255]
MRSDVHGYVALLLHAHIPYVRHDEATVTLEERWFFEAVADSYLPLIDMMDRLLEEGVPFRITLSLSPPLLAMLDDPRMQRRTRKHLATLCELAQREVIRLWGHADFGPVARSYADRYHRHLVLYDRLRGDLIGKFRSLSFSGCLELITCAATHAFLPLIKQDAALRAQLEAAVREFRRHFGSPPAGIWLPECGYTPAAEPHLKALGLRYFVVDAHAHPAAGQGLPLRSPGGACVFARDHEAGAQVWSAESGYPGDADYREYYRDIGFDLGRDGGAEWEYLKPYVLPDGARVHTGFKYYRVTGSGDAKAPYHPARAAQKAQLHAEHFVASRVAQLSRIADGAAQPPVIVCPYDAELFGHWWHEGHQWLEAVLRGFAAQRDAGVATIEMTTLGGYAAAHAPAAAAVLPESSWGRGGYAEVWLQPRSQWVQPLLHAAEDRMVLAAQRHRKPEPLQLRALNQAVRELMLAQSSDWTFILDAETVTSYAVKRIKTHIDNFHNLLNLTEAEQDSAARELSELVIALEKKSPLLPEVDYRCFQPPSILAPSPSALPEGASRLRILMLAWEYPPRVIGGLARAVCGLSEALAADGHDVHVVTCLAPDCAPYEVADGVHVHRVEVLSAPGTLPFLDWVFQMNLAFTDTILRLSGQGVRFDIVHAHDWLVYHAAQECREALGVPLLATIHATEAGRNQGKLDTPVQKRIHQLEQQLTETSDHLIVCSQAMQQEVARLFQVPSHKVNLIPNGVKPFRVTAADHQGDNPSLAQALSLVPGNPPQRILAFLGRLVYEKGVHILLAAMSDVLHAVPEAKLIIAGAGPELGGLQELAAPLGDAVVFTGFLDDKDKGLLLHRAELCIFPSLYEPFGLVALEAMASRTPLIVSDTGGLSEIVEHEVTGITVSPGNAELLAAQIVRLLQHPSEGVRLASGALFEVTNRYRWEQIAAVTSGIYSQMKGSCEPLSGIFPHQKEIIK